ncbi:hypothetical protein D9757_004856 [Collybiopsis confluens]|uniref:BRCT domain-containing protein n=1 Tax=Collybiopsis confluens TaxID=2823264 RepID=A0A8H5MCE5_9AGAR|nr:hypothetical protein D9757_004856 [Collybiopsis confluens]
MRRRGHKSSKVPNVKLRPALPGAISDIIRVQDSQVDSDDSSRYIDPTPRPFLGIVLCATGIQDKPGVFKQAVELGAVTTNDFTDRVTHLIAAQHGGAKYQCALEQKVPILKPEWVTSSYHIWLHGDDVDLEESIRIHRLPIFSSVVLCVSGVQDLARRTEINKLLTLHGGTYVKALERPVRVTHLLCSGDEERDKMYYAEKFNASGEANIKLVWEEWFWDSLEFGGRFNEDNYQARQPRPKSRKSIQVDEPEITSAFIAQERVNAHPQPVRTVTFVATPSNESFEDEPIQATVRKPVGFQKELWRSVLAPRGYEWNDDASVLVKSPTRANGHSRPVNDQQPVDSREHGKSVLMSSSFRRANSFSVLPSKQPLKRLVSTRFGPVAALDISREGDNSENLEREASTQSVELAMEMDNHAPRVGPSASAPALESEFGIFSGLRMTALGEASCDNVREAIQSAGGSWVDFDTMNAGDYEIDIILIRLVSGSKLLGSSSSIQKPLRAKVRTECWLEKCLYDSRLLSPDNHVSFTPVDVPCPILGTEKVKINLSGFDHAEKIFITRLMKVLGLELSSNFTKRTTHLLCPSATGLKFEKAQEWGIPVLGMEWVEQMKKSGVVPDTLEYLLAPMRAQSAIKPERKAEHDPKGKRKAIEVDTAIADITNYQDTNLAGKQAGGPLLTPQKEQKAVRPSITTAPSISSLTTRLTIEDDSIAKGKLFGQPTALLVSSSTVPPPPSDDQQRRSSSIADPLPERKDTPTSVASPSRDQQGQPSNRRSDSDETISRAHEEVNAPPGADPSDMALDPSPLPPPPQEEVPSSNTPSPIKLFAPDKGKGKARALTRSSSARSNRSSSASPSKISPSKYYPPAPPIDSETTKALHESLTSLLGKRRSDESEREGRGGRSRSGNGDRINGKRPRGMRSKTSEVTIEDPAVPGADSLHAFDSFGGGGGDGGDSDAFSFGFGQADNFHLEIGQDQTQEESIRVTYEHPEQHAEKRKLMRLLASPTQEPEDATVRKSSKGRTYRTSAAAASSNGEVLIRRRLTRKSGG